MQLDSDDDFLHALEVQVLCVLEAFLLLLVIHSTQRLNIVICEIFVLSLYKYLIPFSKHGN